MSAWTRQGNTLYVIALGWPEEGRLNVTSLRERTYLGPGGIRAIRLLGCDGQGLHIDLPPVKPHEHAYAFEIQVEGEIEE